MSSNRNASSDRGVVIIGSGAAGLTAGYDLKRKGIPFQILEASTCMGGRLQKLEDFADFPIDSGAELIFGHPVCLKAIVDDKAVDIRVRTCYYDPNPVRQWVNSRWKKTHWESEYHKFIRYTWYDFFQDYIAKHIQNDIHYGCVVRSVDYSGDAVQITCRDGQTFEADQVILTVPIKILQDGDIDFSPPLPGAKMRALESVPFEPGIKMFIEFTEQFYFSGFEINDPKYGHGEIYFWDVTYGQGSTKNILGVFAFGAQALKYTDLEDDELIEAILKLLDDAYKGRASETYVKHFAKNWTKTENVRGMYASYRKGLRHAYTIMQPVKKKLFFAGEALPADGAGFGFVHGAALSGRRAARLVKRVRKGKHLPINLSAFMVHVVSTLCCGLEQKLFFYDS